jgi:predicted Zn-dependent protease
MIDRRGLQHALERRGVAEWSVIERAQQLGAAEQTIDSALPSRVLRAAAEPPLATARVHRAEHRTRWQVTVHEDLATGLDKVVGRGSAHLDIDAATGDPEAVVDQALALARAAVGPPWRSSPTAAPARVRLADEELASAEPLAIADGLVRGVHAPAGITVTGAASVLREEVHAIARGGVHTSWIAALARVELLVASDAHALVIAREARQLAELDLDAAVQAAVADLALLATAGVPAPGPCALVLAADAMLEGGLGVWEAFAAQADAVVERQGLTRYREHMPIVPGADQVAEPLTIASDGALEYGTRSAPLADDGDAVRRFPLVERGIAAGLGLPPREAALRHRDPNGGVRNLVVATGSWSPGEVGAGRVVELRRLRSLTIDPYTGDASLEIALGLDGGKPFAGGTIRLDLIAALAHARRSRKRLRRGPYWGPQAVWIERAELIA